MRYEHGYVCWVLHEVLWALWVLWALFVWPWSGERSDSSQNHGGRSNSQVARGWDGLTLNRIGGAHCPPAAQVSGLCPAPLPVVFPFPSLHHPLPLLSFTPLQPSHLHPPSSIHP